MIWFCAIAGMTETNPKHRSLLLDLLIIAVGAALLNVASRFGLDQPKQMTNEENRRSNAGGFPSNVI